MKIESELTDQPLVRARLMVLMGNVYKNLGVPDESRRLLERGIELGQEVMDEDLGPSLWGRNSLGWLSRDDFESRRRSIHSRSHVSGRSGDALRRRVVTT